MTIKDSGKRYQSPAGGVRDTDEGKPRYTLIPTESLRRVAMHYTEGLKKYKKDNWKGLSTPEDIDRLKDSAYRHMLAYFEGENDEDHAAACVWNMLTLIYFDEQRKERETQIDDKFLLKLIKENKTRVNYEVTNKGE